VLSRPWTSSDVVAPLPEAVVYEGLDAGTRKAVRDLLHASVGAVNSVAKSPGDPGNMTTLIRVVRKYLLKDGLAGWVACRCAVSLLEVDVRRFRSDPMRVVSPVFIQTNLLRHRIPDRTRIVSQWRSGEEWRCLESELTAYYRAAVDAENDGSDRSQVDYICREKLSDICPRFI
jgi:hypothetical protein